MSRVGREAIGMSASDDGHSARFRTARETACAAADLSLSSPKRVPSPTPDPESLFLANLPLIEQLAGSSARHLRMPPADAEDFVSHVKIRLIENDYAKLRQYRGDSSIKGFLSATIAHLGLDYADHLWGKWRT